MLKDLKAVFLISDGHQGLSWIVDTYAAKISRRVLKASMESRAEELKICTQMDSSTGHKHKVNNHEL